MAKLHEKCVTRIRYEFRFLFDYWKSYFSLSISRSSLLSLFLFFFCGMKWDCLQWSNPTERWLCFLLSWPMNGSTQHFPTRLWSRVFSDVWRFKIAYTVQPVSSNNKKMTKMTRKRGKNSRGFYDVEKWSSGVIHSLLLPIDAHKIDE